VGYYGNWFDSLKSSGALFSGLSGRGAGFSLATGIKGQVDKAERQWFEKQIKDLQDGRNDDNRWWREYTSGLEETRKEGRGEDRKERDKNHRELVDSFNSLRDAILARSPSPRPGPRNRPRRR